MADSLNKGDLVAAIAGETGLTQTAVAGVLDAFFGVVSTSVAKGTKVVSHSVGQLDALSAPLRFKSMLDFAGVENFGSAG